MNETTDNLNQGDAAVCIVFPSNWSVILITPAANVIRLMLKSSVAIFLFAFTGTACGTLWAADDLPFATVLISSREVDSERMLEGTVEAVNQSTVSAQTAGQVVEINYDVDDFVPKDSIIVRLRDTEQSAAVAQAKAETERAKARYLEAKKNLRRAEALYANKNISKANYDAAKADERSAKAQQQAASAKLKQADEQLGYTVVRAPYDGVVTRRHIQVGETAGPGQPLMTGLSLENLRVRVDVPQQLLYAIRAHSTARVVHPDPQHEPIVTQNITVFPYASEGSNTFRVRLQLPAGIKGLFPGMFVKAAFAIGKRDSIVVPMAAVVHRNEVVGVYVVKPSGVVRLRQIRAGYKTDDQMIEVLAGLAQGERVALDPIRAAVYLKEAAFKDN